MQEVWLKWEMNRMFRAEMSWNREFLERKYLGDELKKIAVFKKFYNDMKERVYYQLDLKDGEDFSYDDIDETKIDALKNKKDRKEVKEKTGIDLKPYHYLYLSEFYFPFGNVDDRKMEKFNMHTFNGKGVEPEKISLVKIVEKDGEREIEKNDALSVGIHIYDKNKDKISEFDLLHDFITFVKNRLKDEKEQGISSEGKVVDEIKKEQNILNRMNDKIGYFYNQKDIDREER